MKKQLILLLIAFFSIVFVSPAQVMETIVLPTANQSGGMPLMEALKNRQSQRSYSSKELTQQQLSDMLWAAYGINRPDGFRTVPSARTWNEFDIYIIKAEGWYVYDPQKHAMLKLGNEDLRVYSATQDFAHKAPVNLIFVADFDRMTNADDDFRKFYSAADAGYISQNVYLYCASEGLATIVRGQIDKVKAREVLKLRPNQHIILAQTVGYPGN
ncbi:MAG: SagB/ThcOx family dehydrogenase [Bacteroidota bacterium]